MNINYKSLRRPTTALMALALVVGSVIPVLQQGQANAAQFSDRSIKLSDSTPSATTGLQYALTFTPAANAQEVIVDFCGDTPLIGATCAFSAATVPTISSPTVDVGSVATVGSGSPVHTVLVTGLTLTAATPVTITFTGGFTNPSTAAGTSFYARVLTYATGNGSGYSPANSTGGATTTGTYVDYGGIAMSTVRQISITARVMETLTFCVSGVNIDGTGGASVDECAESTAPALEIGQGTPKVLDAGSVDAATAYMQLSTNATSGAIVRMKATNTCAVAGLTTAPPAGTCSIPGIDGGTDGSTPKVLTAGTAAFGLFVSDSRTTTGIASSVGTITADANYNDSTHENEGTPSTIYYGMDNRNSTEGVRSTYGDPIAASAGPVSRINNNLVFAATPSLTTPAGIYTGNEILIATGTF
jgi:hypothetical protein